jgi:HK97 family phage portal protein
MFGLRPVEQRADQYEATIRAINERRLVTSYSGVSASYADMLTIPAVAKSLMLTAGIIAVMPIDAYRVRGDERSELQVLPRLLREPSAVIPLEDWLYQCIESMIMHGDAVGRIVARDARLFPTQIELVDPAIVTIKTSSAGVLNWFFDRKPVPAEDVWHLAGRPRVGSQFGIGLIETMMQTAGIALATRKYEAQWFGDGAHPTSILRPSIDPGPVGAQALKDKFLSIVRGNREPVVLPTGTEFETLQETPVNSALLEAMRHNATDIAQFFNVPPELVGGVSGDSMTYSNVESRVLDLLAFGVQFWMVKLEKALSRLLPQPMYVKFNENAVVRTDVKTKVDSLVAQVAGGIMTQNEARKPLDLPAIPGGDTLAEVGTRSRELSLVEAIQKVYLGVGTMITADEVRQIINTMGGNLPVPGPIPPPGATA